MNALSLPLSLPLVLALASSAAFAHGGEDHGAVPPPPTAGADGRTAVALTPSVELVLPATGVCSSGAGTDATASSSCC